MKRADRPSKSDCYGCSEDFYNTAGEGAELAPGGECWSFKTATMKKVRLVHINTMPDKNGSFDRVKAERKPSCYRKPQFVRVEVR